MKTFWKTEDRAIDNLLRSHIARRGKSASDCRGFDPDTASAYIEKGLTSAELARYEDHIAACAACRTNVIALWRMVEADAPSVESAAAAPASVVATNRPSGFGSLLARARAPRFALAAIAVIVLAVSIPVYLSRKDATSSGVSYQSEPAMAQSKEAQDTQASVELNPSPPISGNVAAQSGDIDQNASAAGPNEKQEAGGSPQGGIEEAAVADQQPSEFDRQARAQSGQKPDAPAPPQTKKIEAEAGNERTNEIAPGRVTARAEPPAPPPAPQTPTKEQETGRIDSTDSLRAPGKGKDSADMRVLQPARIAEESKREGDDTTIRPGDVVPPATSTRSDESRERRGIAGNTPGNKLRRESVSKSASESGSPERKIGSKKFYKLNDFWTDKDYNPAKERPEITVIRDSDVYKEMLTKHRGLKLYFINFAKDERAIIVYKGTVYKLVPQE
ncbi:MAG: zf-HC2 domain-containing protein [Blastocatellia bacterium]|nr:zf-HC2 domain-containing protein [Blastocatellia bacterium]